MAKHPCGDGLTKECFQQYPEWAKETFAKRLLHLLVDPKAQNLLKRLSAKLPGFLTIQPPPGWDPSDSPPPIIIPPTPPPDRPPPPPPIIIPPWTPGPINPPRPGPPAIDIGSLVISQGSTAGSVLFGHTAAFTEIALARTSDIAYTVYAIKIKLGKVGNPTDTVNIEIWRTIPLFRPVELVTGGTATPIPAIDLPAFAVDQPDITIYFPNHPQCATPTHYTVVFARTGAVDADNHYAIGWELADLWTYYKHNPPANWTTQTGGYEFDLEVWGTAG